MKNNYIGNIINHISIISEREIYVNSSVRHIPQTSPWMQDQVDLKLKSKQLGFNRKWYRFWS